MTHIIKTMEWGGKTLTIETGKMARQANGSVLVKYGNTNVLVAVTGRREAKPDAEFFPLTVEYKEKFYAIGKIPGGFFKRESKPSKRETLTSRLIDRTLRPMFPEGFYNEVQVIATVLSYDSEVDADVAALVGASAALAVSDIPFPDAVCGAKVGIINDEFIVNPTTSQLKESRLDLIVAGTKDSVLMIESEAKELTEEQMIAALEFGHKAFVPVIELIEELKAEAGKAKWELTLFNPSEIIASINKVFGKDLKAAYKIAEKHERILALEVIKAKAAEKFLTADNAIAFQKAFKAEQQLIVRGQTLDGKRIDGRDLSAIRHITCDLNVLPQVHGSALFTRGKTQALVVTTLGTDTDAQVYDDLAGDRKENFMLHYNFPPYSVGECGMLKPPGRREIGHGELATRGIKAVLNFTNNPDFRFPTIRVVSEILESDGSSSMATVCGASLALMASGVPLKCPVAGIAMGLIKEEDRFAVISDITGEEDNLGDMDFKVVGTEAGITALQMDIKVRGITHEIMQAALEQAKNGRLHILSVMNEAIKESNVDVNTTAPVLKTMKIDPARIREIIGSGGKNIKEICEASSASIDIKDDGSILIACATYAQYEIALEKINAILSAEPRGRSDRGDRGDRGPRREGGGDRPRFDRREGGSDRGPRREGGDRPRFDRGEGRPDRGDRPRFDRGNDRPEHGNREEGGESRRRFDRPERSSSDRGPRREGGDRPRFDRGEGRPDRGDRPRFDRGNDRPERSHSERGPRSDRGDRPTRGDRPDRSDRDYNRDNESAAPKKRFKFF